MPSLNTKIQAEIFHALPAEAVQSPDRPELKLHEALDIIEGRGSERTTELHAAKRAVERHFAETTDLEEKATSHYYLLRILLAERISHENQCARDLYNKMHAALLVVEENYRREYRAVKSQPEQQIIHKQCEAFYQLVDSYFRTLEIAYENKGLHAASERTHANKMRFRRRAAHFSGRHFVHAGHLFLEHSSNYGHSFLRWGATVAIFIAFFGLIYLVLDLFASGQAFHGNAAGQNLLDYFYFSMITFTTAGFGDIVPLTNAAKFLSGIEALSGYIMLGIFITLIQKRL